MKTIDKSSFANSHFYIGIDSHLKNWKITIRLKEIELKTLSMNPSPLDVLNYLRKNYPGGIYHIVYEAGFSGFWAARKFNELGMDCIVVNPADVPTSNKEKVNKNDPIDSRKLSRELGNCSLTGIYIPDIYHEELRSLMRLRFQIVKDQTRIKNRIKGFLHSRGIKIPDEFVSNKQWSGKFIKWLKEEVKFNTQAGNYAFQNMILQLQQHREHNKNVLLELKEQARKKEIEPIIQVLRSVPGVGFITAMAFYTEVIDIKRFSYEDQLNSFVGIVPSTRSSDDNIYSNQLSYRHNRYLRPLITEAAWRAVREDPAMTAKYKELIKRMTPQEAIIRIAKKLVKRMRCVWLNKVEYIYALVA